MLKKHVLQNHVSIVSKSLIISFQHNIDQQENQGWKE
jgi:hypothetical protein